MYRLEPPVVRRAPPLAWLLLAGLVLLIPRAARADAAPPAKPSAPRVELRLPAEIVYDRTVSADSAVVFRHETHVAYAGDKCTGCHPSPFRMLKPTRRVSPHHAKAAESCGMCHDGRQAFAVRDVASCASCHTGRRAVTATTAAAAPPRALPKPILYRRGEVSPGSVTFRHETHTAAASCVTCHPKRFAMKSAGARPGGGMHEASACGGCHNGRTTFGVEDADACSRCHVERKDAR